MMPYCDHHEIVRVNPRDFADLRDKLDNAQTTSAKLTAATTFLDTHGVSREPFTEYILQVDPSAASVLLADPDSLIA